jgi:hypothetical protein
MKKELIELDATMQKNETCANDSFEVQSKVLALLLNHKVTAFHFPRDWIKQENNEATSELFQCLVAQRPPSLHTLVGLTSCLTEFRTVPNHPFIDALDFLPNIEVLHMDGHLLGDTELCRIADQLPKLR